MSANTKPYLWGKKFCHAENKDVAALHPIHIAKESSTWCGISMLGNNYADQAKDEATCNECIDAYSRNKHKKK